MIRCPHCSGPLAIVGRDSGPAPIPTRRLGRVVAVIAKIGVDLEIIETDLSLTPGTLRTRARGPRQTYGRDVAMWLVRTKFGATYSEVAEVFGRSDHANVMRACRKVERLLAENDERTHSLVSKLTLEKRDAAE